MKSEVIAEVSFTWMSKILCIAVPDTAVNFRNGVVTERIAHSPVARISSDFGSSRELAGLDFTLEASELSFRYPGK